MMTEVKMSLRKHVWMIAVQAPIVIVGVGALVAVAIDLIEVTTGLTVFVAALVISVAAPPGTYGRAGARSAGKDFCRPVAGGIASLASPFS
jgi:hypothetical protein